MPKSKSNRKRGAPKRYDSTSQVYWLPLRIVGATQKERDEIYQSITTKFSISERGAILADAANTKG